MMRKRCLAFLTAALLLLTSFPIPAWAAGTDGTEEVPSGSAGTVLEDGYYSVPLMMTNFVARSGPSVVDGLEDKYRTALLHAENGRYRVTLRIANYVDSDVGSGGKTAKILKEEYYEDFQKQGRFTPNPKEGQAKTFTREEMEEGKYWKKTEVTENAAYGYAEYSFEVEDPTRPVIMASVNSAYEGQAFYKDVGTIASITMKLSLAERLPELDGLQSGTWYYDVSYVTEAALSGTTYAVSGITFIESAGAAAGLRALFKQEVKVEVSGNAALATFTLSESGRENLKEIRKAVGKDYRYKESRRTAPYPIYQSSYSIQELAEDGTVTMEFDLTDYADLAFGCPVLVQAGGHEETHTCAYKDTWRYRGFLRLSTAQTQPVQLRTVLTETGSNGKPEDLEFRLDSTTACVPEGAVLSVERIMDGDIYDAADSTLKGTNRGWRLYRIRLLDGAGNPLDENLSETGVLSLPLPSEYKGAGAYSWNAAKKILQVESGVLDGSFYSVNTSALGYWVLSDDYAFDTWGDRLDSGVYEVEAVIYHMVRKETSMANVALRTPVTLYVEEDGTKTVAFEMGKGYAMGMEAYLADLRYYRKGYEIQASGYPSGPVAKSYVTAYQKTGDGSYLVDGLNYGPLEYYPATLFFELPDDNPVIPVQVDVPIMNLLAEGGGTQDCRFCLDYSTATKLTGEFPLPSVREAIAAAYEVAESAAPGDYTADSYSALAKAMASAKSAYEEEDASEETLSEAYLALRSAISGMKLVEELSLGDGLYTADAVLVSGDGEDSHAAAGRVRRAADGWRIILEAEGLKGLSYLDPAAGEYRGAQMQTDTETGAAKADFTISGLKNEIPILYTYEENDENGISGYLKWNGEFTEQETDRSALEAKLEEAKALLEEAKADAQKYDTQKTAALQTVLADVTTMYVDSMALQAELDEQLGRLTAAVNDLKMGVNLEEIGSILASIREELTETAYTPVSWAKLQEQIDAGQQLMDAAAGGQEVDASEASRVLMLLNAAREGLVERGDKADLQALYENAAAIQNEGQACYDVLQTVVRSTKAVLEDDNAVQSAIDAQYRSLELAVINLYGGMDKTVLKNLVAEIREKQVAGELDGASAESLAYLEAALGTAQEILDNAGAGQQDVDKQISLLESVYNGLTGAEDGNTVYTGVYEIGGYMKHASQDGDSMGNAALEKPMTLAVSVNEETGEAECRLYMDFHSLAIGTQSGYLANLSYFPGYDEEYTLPEGIPESGVTVEEYYEDLYDYYNDPETGKDANWKGKLYPKTMSMPVDLNDDMIWVEVYVPVMEELSAGSGTQYAKLYLYWDELTQISGIATDKEEVLAAKAVLLEQVEAVEALSADDGAEAQAALLRAAAAYGRFVYESMNVDVAVAEYAAAALSRTLDVFSEEAVEADKTMLWQAIQDAQERLQDENIVWEPSAREYLEQILASAMLVYENEQAVVGQVSAWTSVVTAAMENLQALFDKTELRRALDAAKTYLNATQYYVAIDLETLKVLYDAAEAVCGRQDATQAEVDAQVRILNYAVGSLKRVDEILVDKSGLNHMILAATRISGQEAVYTEASLQALRNAIESARKVYDDESATREQVNAQAAAILQAITKLKTKEISGGNNTGGNNNGDNNNGGNTGGNSSGNNDHTGSGSSGGNGSGQGSAALDRTNLADGIYSLTGTMVKIDRSTASMSNEAVNHIVKLTVKNGKYYVTLDFCGLHYAGQYGYLGWMKYFKTGYTLDRYGNPTGSADAVTVDSVQLDDSGKAVEDTFGTNYPNQVTFPLISEAVSDGYVPLQVFVPIMESISAGSGTQPVFLKLDWSTLKKTSADDQAFADDRGSGIAGGDDNSSSNGNDSSSGDSLLNFTSTLKPSGTSSLATSSLKPSSTLKSTASTLKPSSTLASASSALKSTGTASKSSTSSVLKSTAAGAKALSDAAQLKEGSGDAGVETSALTGLVLDGEGTPLGGGIASGMSADPTPVQEKDSGLPVLPIMTSLLAVLAGVLYKLKSRGLLFR